VWRESISLFSGPCPSAAHLLAVSLANSGTAMLARAEMPTLPYAIFRYSASPAR
jgi:hypothetical protein